MISRGGRLLCETWPMATLGGSISCRPCSASASAVAKDWDPQRGPEKSYGYFVGSGGSLCQQVRGLSGIQDSSSPQLVLLDIPDNGGFYLGPQGDGALSEASMRKMLSDYEAGLPE